MDLLPNRCCMLSGPLMMHSLPARKKTQQRPPEKCLDVQPWHPCQGWVDKEWEYLKGQAQEEWQVKEKLRKATKNVADAPEGDLEGTIATDPMEFDSIIRRVWKKIYDGNPINIR